MKLTSSVAALHKEGVIHGDLHADNVLLRNEDGAVLLIDYGKSIDEKSSYVPHRMVRASVRTFCEDCHFWCLNPCDISSRINPCKASLSNALGNFQLMLQTLQVPLRVYK